jgi:serine/threonine protein kinase
MTDKIEIFEQAIELDEEKRASFIRDACGDEALRREVESLLAAHDSAGEFLSSPTGELLEPPPVAPSLPEKLGKVIGRYKLLESIGEGGFGVVYMAQQSEPIRRRVALEIIKLGMDTKQVVARFEAERQALALMDHPNIARVIDGGETDTGRPYFVMELVRGDPITQYCDREKLNTRARLELFQQVCNAVHHAHQKGIIHRDIKPSNVMVTVSDDKPMVKVIDFGIAKATNLELTEKTLFTEFRQLIGTPQYMSPEQAERSGVDVDTRSDVYSLGVLLYEMLTGRTPIDSKKMGAAAWHELQRIICEEEPTKPSAVVSSGDVDAADVAKRRSTDASRLGGVLRGDLDWIVLKSLEKDRSRRYASASQFAEDIRRYLSDEPVEATPPSAAYKLTKFARRNKPLLAGVAAVFVALLLGLITTSVMTSVAVQARAEGTLLLAKANKAANESKIATRKARRSAIIAGASLLLPDDEVDALANEWQEDLAAQRPGRSEDDKEFVREEVQFASWYAAWLVRHSRGLEAIALLNEHYARAKRVLGTGDSSFLAFSNTCAQTHILQGSRAESLVPIYDDLLESLEKVHGIPQATVMLPEYAAVLVRAGQSNEAAVAIKTYLARRAKDTSPPETIELGRLDNSIDALVGWGESNAELFEQLKEYRNTGLVSENLGGGESDPELIADLKFLQGSWEWSETVGGKTTHMVIEIVGSEVETKWMKPDGSVERGRSGRMKLGRSGRMKLGRSGAAKIYTVTLGNDAASAANFIYTLTAGQFVIVSGMLVNHGSLPETKMRKWTRLASDE